MKKYIITCLSTIMCSGLFAQLTLSTTQDKMSGTSGTQVLFLPSQTTFIGSLAVGTGLNFLQSTSSGGINNTAMGMGTLDVNTTGLDNTGMGQACLFANTSGSLNSAFGRASLGTNLTGVSNTAVGGSALYNSKASFNVAVGAYANQQVTTGSNNVAIGYNAAGSLTTGSNNIAIGAHVTFASNSASNQLNIGDYITGTDNNSLKTLRTPGRLIIGTVPATIPNNYGLIVGSGILAQKVKVALKDGSNWSDYVFDSKYYLQPLGEVEAFIKKNKHLPGIPSAENLVEEGGIDLTVMLAKQMEKIEELTLYIIEMKKEIIALQSANRSGSVSKSE